MLEGAKLRVATRNMARSCSVSPTAIVSASSAQDPVAKGNKTGPFVGLLGYDSCVDRCVMESQPIKP